jgi:magnesium chelatase family protein
VVERPFRAPHHTCTQTALTGGGRTPTPGEITLAAKGILFLDELPEYSKSTIEVLRQPMEEGYVTISRVEGSQRYPCDCIFMAAMNPCRCGFFPDREKCRCTEGEIHRYLDKVSEPLLDRMDMSVELAMPEFGLYGSHGETSEQIRQRVERTVAIQQKRYRTDTISYNGELSGQQMEKYCPLGKEEMDYLKEFFEEEQCSMRRLNRIIRVARTIADRELSDDISVDHLAQAISLRSINKKYWGGER